MFAELAYRRYFQMYYNARDPRKKMAPGLNPEADPSKRRDTAYGVPRRNIRMITMIPVITAAMPMRMPPTAVESPETDARWTEAESARAVAEAEAAARAAPKAASLIFMFAPFLVYVIFCRGTLPRQNASP